MKSKLLLYWIIINHTTILTLKNSVNYNILILLYLPVYTPQYNPIEQVWKSIKRIIYDSTISDYNELIKIFEEEYYKIIYKPSFVEKWIEKFL